MKIHLDDGSECMPDSKKGEISGKFCCHSQYTAKNCNNTRGT